MLPGFEPVLYPDGFPLEKRLELIKDKKDELDTDHLKPMEVAQTTWKCYIPSILIGVGTITCIIGIGCMDKRNQVSLMSAYAMLNESYKQYRKSAKIVYGENADDKIHAEMAKDAMVSTYDAMNEIIAQYEVVSVADLYDLANVSNDNYAANKYGWTDIGGCRAVRVRDGYILKLPKPMPL